MASGLFRHGLFSTSGKQGEIDELEEQLAEVSGDLTETKEQLATTKAELARVSAAALYKGEVIG